MPTQLNEEFVHSQEVRRFVEVAEELCSIVEKVDSLPRDSFLMQLLEKLSLVYSVGQLLGDPYLWDDDDEDVGDKISPHSDAVEAFRATLTGRKRWKDWMERIGEKLGPYRELNFVFDPADPEDTNVVQADLALEIADIYCHVSDGLRTYEQPCTELKAAAIWDLWFGLRHDWGAHILETLLPIHRIMHNHYFEGEFDR